MRIDRHALEFGPKELLLPERAVILRFGFLDEDPFLWVLGDPEAVKELRAFYLVSHRGVTAKIDADWKHISSKHINGPHSALTHLFEVPNVVGGVKRPDSFQTEDRRDASSEPFDGLAEYGRCQRVTTAEGYDALVESGAIVVGEKGVTLGAEVCVSDDMLRKTRRLAAARDPEDKDASLVVRAIDELLGNVARRPR